MLGSLLGCISDCVSTSTFTREQSASHVRDSVDLGVRARPGFREAPTGSVNSLIRQSFPLELRPTFQQIQQKP